ncbi:MAG: hypothetical protein WC393_05330 [Candidatus Nanoarchaeia archaeon]|jgi:hypothetical protein
MKHKLIPEGFDSLKSATNKILSLNEERMKLFLYYLSESFKTQAISDEKKGYFKLCSLGLKLSKTLYSAEYCLPQEDEDKKLSEFSSEISYLRYDSIHEIFCQLKRNATDSESWSFLRNFNDSLESIIQITKKMDELSNKHY